MISHLKFIIYNNAQRTTHNAQRTTHNAQRTMSHYFSNTALPSEWFTTWGTTKSQTEKDEIFHGLQVGPISVSAGYNPTDTIAYWWPVLNQDQRSSIWKQICPAFRIGVAQQVAVQTQQFKQGDIGSSEDVPRSSTRWLYYIQQGGVFEEDPIEKVKSEEPTIWHWGTKPSDDSSVSRARQWHEACVSGGYAFISASTEEWYKKEKPGQKKMGRVEQIGQFKQEAQVDDYIYLHSATNGGVTHWGKYTGHISLIDEENIGDFHHLGIGPDSSTHFVSVDKWVPFPHPFKGKGFRKTLYKADYETPENYETSEDLTLNRTSSVDSNSSFVTVDIEPALSDEESCILSEYHIINDHFPKPMESDLSLLTLSPLTPCVRSKTNGGTETPQEVPCTTEEAFNKARITLHQMLDTVPHPVLTKKYEWDEIQSHSPLVLP